MNAESRKKLQHGNVGLVRLRAMRHRLASQGHRADAGNFCRTTKRRRK
jgi:hypothetical protein